MKMVSDVYSHIIDEDRRVNAQRFEEAFYSGVPHEGAPNESVDEEKAKLIKLLDNPEVATLLKTLAQAL